MTAVERRVADLKRTVAEIQAANRPTDRATIVSLHDASAAATAAASSGSGAGGGAASGDGSADDAPDPEATRLMLEYMKKRMAEASGECARGGGHHHDR